MSYPRRQNGGMKHTSESRNEVLGLASGGRCKEGRSSNRGRSGAPAPTSVLAAGPFYTTEEMAAVLKVSERTLKQMMRRGELPYLKVGCRVVRFILADVRQWLRRRYMVWPAGWSHADAVVTKEVL